MSYTPINWVDGETRVDAEHLNKMEQGIKIANEKADAAVKTVNGIAPDENGNVVVAGGSGITDTEKTLILSLFRNAAYTSADMGNVLTQLEALWSGGEVEPDEPSEPDTPEKTLTSISAVYSGGSVTAGTAVSALTGIVVTAHYSDGTSATVTGYTLSGTIAEGSNTITVSYGGKTTTFTVTGVAESGGEDNVVDAWTAYEWDMGYRLYGNANVQEGEKFTTSEYISLENVEKIVVTAEGNNLSGYALLFFDASQAYISTVSGYISGGNQNYPSPVNITIPDGAAYTRLTTTDKQHLDGSSSGIHVTYNFYLK